ncbi:MAG: protein-methionine-sulfoxide reductase catalytic subunit MsrP [Kordiimonadaceae bacterium]|nr:protein-methionine-sulfoxide reductase catalytic subunit MsrP [Kordiimonadaceae bacterium]MBT6031943.1 protein-methionine-sulfoxide reductase catalytic subunit MsrP [Kordiimonadaceae bacterium]
MLIKIKNSWDLKESDVTSEANFLSRRKFIQAAGIMGAGTAASIMVPSMTNAQIASKPGSNKYDGRDLADQQTSLDDIMSYNNFYEFGVDKGDPMAKAHTLITDPWSVTVEGHCENPGEYSVEDLVDHNALEERIYRMRCVEAWSMVIPWVGVSLSQVINKLKPTAKAKYIYFETLVDKKQMPGQVNRVIRWPYREGLRMDEAMNPLAIMAVGLYGRKLTKQNGAPLRMVVPWKYGFKGIKSIVKISFVEKQPVSSWMRLQSEEYGFYANVNPRVSHPRWSQSKERRIGEFTGIGGLSRQKTLMFNGYGEQVAHLYDGMNLRRNF